MVEMGRDTALSKALWSLDYCIREQGWTWMGTALLCFYIAILDLCCVAQLGPDRSHMRLIRNQYCTTAVYEIILGDSGAQLSNLSKTCIQKRSEATSSSPVSAELYYFC
jgi:hypothetical protein